MHVITKYTTVVTYPGDSCHTFSMHVITKYTTVVGGGHTTVVGGGRIDGMGGWKDEVTYLTY